jgi:hypothetical protein
MLASGVIVLWLTESNIAGLNAGSTAARGSFPSAPAQSRNSHAAASDIWAPLREKPLDKFPKISHIAKIIE